MPADPARLAVARQLLDQLGLSPADLLSQDVYATNVPTFAEYLPKVVAAAGSGARRAYGSYWTRMATAWGERPLTAIAASEIEALQRTLTAAARTRRNSRNGRYAGEHVIAAARAFFKRAIADGLIDADASPAHRVAKPRRLPSTRRALSAEELDAINKTARDCGNDAVLDALLLRLHTETACRRGGALGLRLMDFDAMNGLVRLTEKGETQRWQPISLDLAAALSDHARARGVILASDQLLRYRDGQPLTSRRYDQLWHRIGQQLPWVAAQAISTHWLRHTTLTWVERQFGYGVARAYAGHTDSTGPATTTYIKADVHAVATALAALTGQPHPLAISAYMS